MQIGYFGDGRWAHRALDQIIEASGLYISYIVARHSDPDPALERRANEIDAPFFIPKNVNEVSFLNELDKYEPDVNVSMSYDQILQADIIESAPKGFINCHAGALPFYRGRNVLNWALINGEDRFGVTVHYVDEGIDTGDIITQRFCAITPSDNYSTLIDKAVELCADALIDALQDLQWERASRTPQEDIHPVGFYCSRRREGDEWINWSWTTDRIHDFVRAIAPPGPGARTMLDNKPIVVLNSEKISQAPEYIDRPGSVVGRDEKGIIVKTGDATLKVTCVADWQEGRKNPRTPKHRIGTTFDTNVLDEITQLRTRIEKLERRLNHLSSSLGV